MFYYYRALLAFLLSFSMLTSHLQASQSALEVESSFKKSLRSVVGSSLVGALGFGGWNFLSGFELGKTMDEAYFNAYQSVTMGLIVGAGLGLSYSLVLTSMKAAGLDLQLPDLINFISRFPAVKPHS